MIRQFLALVPGQRFIEFARQFLRGHLLLAATYAQMGRIEDAEREAE